MDRLRDRKTRDVLIVGGGPAGLSAALLLGRCRRSVLLCDGNEGRNRAARAVHGFLTRDGIAPAALRRIGREQLRPYGIEVRDVKVASLARIADGFEATLSSGERVRARKVLVATGLADHLPEVPGLRELYGKSVFHCPYCDAWEVRDQPLGVIGRGRKAVELASKLLLWSDDVVLFTNGWEPRAEVPHVGVETERIERLEARRQKLERVVLASGRSVERRALFFPQATYQRSKLTDPLGPKTEAGSVKTGKLQESRIRGIWVAGDAARDVRFAIVAAAEGVKAAYAINTELLAEEEPRRKRRAA